MNEKVIDLMIKNSRERIAQGEPDVTVLEQIVVHLADKIKRDRVWAITRDMAAP